MLPMAAMSTEERACCKHMAKQCGDAGMSQSHSCCQRSVGGLNFDLLPAKSNLLNHQLAVLALHFIPATADLVLPTETLLSRGISIGHAPPGSPPSSISVLRI